MLVSMTGFGAAAKIFGSYEIDVELKTLNHRYLDVKVRLPQEYSSFEIPLREQMQLQFSRGSIELKVYRKFLPKKAKLEIIVPSADTVAKKLRNLQRQLRLSGDLSLDHLLHVPDLVRVDVPRANLKQEWGILKKLVSDVVAATVVMRKKEGKALEGELLDRLKNLEKIHGDIKNLAPSVVEHYRAALKKRLEALSSEFSVDERRLEQEMAFMADRCDVSEELARLLSHFKQLRELVKGKGLAGKKLDFLCQEIFREINTIGSKGSHSQISRAVIEFKGELEKLREQVQNIE